MKFEEDKRIEKFGKKVGYLTSYIIFTTVLYFILKYLNKLPSNWSYFHVVGLTFFIVLIGITIKRVLK